MFERARGIFVYRNISDIDNILSYPEQEYVKGGRVRIIQPKTCPHRGLTFFTQAVVLGSGLIGLEAAKAVFDL
jgi:nitrite reductase (NAD(P)H)